MIIPTVGRVVWFYQRVNPMNSPSAAIIAHVHSNSLVNLGVFSSDGESRGERDVRLVQDGEKAPDGGHYCTWMPYQIGQAAKTEALEKKLTS